MPGTNTVAEIVEILRTGHFDPLIGIVETLQVEAKSEPYNLTYARNSALRGIVC